MLYESVENNKYHSKYAYWVDTPWHSSSPILGKVFEWCEEELQNNWTDVT